MTSATFRLVSAALLVAASLLPLVGAQDAPAPAADEERPTSVVTFYGHVFGHTLGNPMPSNTQFPIGEDNYGLGTQDVCTSQFQADTGSLVTPGANCDTDPNNKLAFYSTAGFVQVSSGSEFTGGGGYAQLHNERGSTKDIVLDTTGEITASVYASQDAHAWSVSGAGGTYCLAAHPYDMPCLYPYWGWDPGFSPAMQVEATLYHAVLGEYGGNASDQPPLQEAIESGGATLVAKGASTPQQVIDGLPGNPNVVRFDVNLGAPQVEVIPKEASFFMVFSIYQIAPDGSKFSTNSWRWWSGEFFPPTYTLPVKNAFDVENVLPQFVHGKLAILGIINTPWGSYDVDPKATKLTITREGGEEITPVRIETLADYSVAHGAHYKPVNVTFVWDYQADKLPAGTYTVAISAANHQKSAAASCTASFTIDADGRGVASRPGTCGQQTGAEHASEVGEAGAPAASGDSSRPLLAPPGATAPSLPLVGLAGLVLVSGRRWTK